MTPVDRHREASYSSALNAKRRSAGSYGLRQVLHSLPLILIAATAITISTLTTTVANAEPFEANANEVLQEFCTDCHNHQKSKGKVNITGLIEANAFGEDFRTWDLVNAMLREKEMPPEDEPQPSPAQRAQLIELIEEKLAHAEEAVAGDPGPIVLRRLTSAEFNYAIEDLTGLDLQLDRLIGSDAVGGEGFSNVGEVQFVQDATIERYLEAAKTVASHALIGSGPLSFAANPGKTGQELDAINRILAIYRKHGFRTGAGEGAEAFGLEQYPKAFFNAWRYRHRDKLGLSEQTIESLASEEGIHPRFARHIWDVLNQATPKFPAKDIVEAWQSLPPADPSAPEKVAKIRQACDALYTLLGSWQTGLAANTNDDEEAAVLAERQFIPQMTHSFRVGVSWPLGSTEGTFKISVSPSCVSSTEAPVVVWERPRLGIRGPRQSGRRNRRFPALRSLLPKEQVEALRFGQGANGESLDADSFAVTGASEIEFRFPVSPESRGGFFMVEARLDVENGDNCLVRCTVSDGLVPGETVASTGASAALLADPDSPQLNVWQEGISDFARILPQVSHREPAPSDRDPIPAPFDNTYNNAERNSFHYVIKYHRDDTFLTEYLIDPDVRIALDQAWIDLLSAFEYHNTYYNFVTKKFEIPYLDQEIAALSSSEIQKIAPEPRKFIERLHTHYGYTSQALQDARPGHLEDAIKFASQAWRRPLSTHEQAQLHAFYSQLRTDPGLDHPAALRALLSRILVAPSFIYRLETTPDAAQIVTLSPQELANRLSFFLWSSFPDEQLIDAAKNNRLTEPEQLKQEIRRMLAAPRARRFATEFFGQWLGFYRFDYYRGIDTGRFPEFDDGLKASMYKEAISFFEHIVREDRPIRDLLLADYTFLNPSLANHYGIEAPDLVTDSLQKVSGVEQMHRGGLLQLGAILTTTSAPLRTSAVKRGEWILRRILGTPVPPPPADAGSIPADDVLADGLTVRARLEAHRTDPTCANCHSRIDPLGFALEHFDPIGRWRNTYRDGQAIDDTGQLSDGSPIAGLPGLRNYLDQNGAVFRRNLSTKLIGYALGRSTLVSDQPLIDDLTESLIDESPFSELVFRIATSPQFQRKRGDQALDENPDIETSVVPNILDL